MPVYLKKRDYTLKKHFVGGGGVYNLQDARDLVLWARLKESPEDSSVNSITISYTGSPTTSNPLIPNKSVCRIGELPAAEFPSSSEFAAVAASSHLDFSGEVPFTISGWVKLETSGTKTIVSMPNVANSDAGWWLLIKNSSLQLSLGGTGGGAIISSQLPGAIPPDVWSHFAATYDGRGHYTGINLYVNGRKAITKNDSAGTFTSLDADGSRSLKIGIGWNSTIHPLQDSLSEVSIWKKELSKSAVTALYHATAGRYVAKSGIVSLPNRVRLRDVDSLTGSYPTHLRTTGFSGSLKGNGKQIFNDTKTQIFKSIPDAIFPLVNDKENLENANLTNLIASPNQNSNLVGKGIAGPFLSTQGFRSHIDYGMENHAFDETRVSLLPKEVHFYASGTSGSIYSGFSSPLRDKIAISIPINNSTEKMITRFNTKELPWFDSENEGIYPPGFQSTGFYYYNFSGSRWEDKGFEYSSFSGDAINTMFYYSDTPMGYNTIYLGRQIPRWDGTLLPAFVGGGPKMEKWTKMQQFKMSDHSGVVIDSKADPQRFKSEDPYAILTASLAYDKIGAPTVTGLAPANSRYHATSSQLVPLSDYIARPFLLEKAVLEIPVIVQRQRGDYKYNDPNTRYYESSRDIDNYTFFLYRQRRAPGAERDVHRDENGSTRMLVASGCASFYNSNAFSGRVPEMIKSRGLPHGPAFSHDWDVSANVESGLAGAPLITAFTGTIRIEMEAAVGNGQPLGSSRFPIISTSVAAPSTSSLAMPNGFRSVCTQDFWCGGVQNYSGSTPYNKSVSSDQAVSLPINSSNFIGDIKNTVVAALSPYGIGQTSTPSTCSMGPNNFSIFRSERSLLPLSLGTSLWNEPRKRVHGDTNTQPAHDGKLAPYPKESLGIIGYTNMYYPTTAGTLFRIYPTFFGPYAASQTSPFLFFPGDDLVLGIDAGISMLQASGSSANLDYIAIGADAGSDLGFYSASAADRENFGCMSGSFMKILTGEANITLFGSEVKENHEMLLSTNQNLTSNAIHEAIGTERVLDQFEIMSRLDMSGSYLDRHVVGAMVKSMNTSNALSIDGGLNWAGDGIQFDDAVATVSPARRVLGLHSKRYIKVPSAYGAAASKDSRKIFGITEFPVSDPETGTPPWMKWPISGWEITRDPGFITPGPATVIGAPINSLQRFITLNTVDEIFYDSMEPSITDLVSRSEGMIYIPNGVHNATAAGKIPMLDFSATSSVDYVYRTNPQRYMQQNFVLRLHATKEGHISPSTIYLDFYNKNSLSAQRIRRISVFNRGFFIETGKAPLTPTSVDREFDYGKVHGQGAYGTRYGMISPTIKKSKSIFRMNRYGQFRDMLEQRNDTKYFGMLDNETRTLVGDGPIQVKFVNQSDGVTPVDPYSTDSFNFWPEYSSSCPYNESDPTTVDSDAHLDYILELLS